MRVKTLVISLLMVMLFGQISYASVQIIPSQNTGGSPDCIVLTTVTNSYLLCQQLNTTGETLNGTGDNVKPHLATNADWGAVSYLANSSYGENTEGKNTGVEIYINTEGKITTEGGENANKYYSTTGNFSGVMNWGSNPRADRLTQTSALISNYNENDEAVAGNKANLTELINAKNTNSPFVEIINTSGWKTPNTAGMAMVETNAIYGGYNGAGADVNYPISLRTGLFGYYIGIGSVTHGMVLQRTTGAAYTSVTFRPVIWN